MKQFKCVVTGKTFDGDGDKSVDVILDNGFKAHIRIYVKEGTSFVNEDVSKDGAEKIKSALNGIFKAGK